MIVPKKFYEQLKKYEGKYVVVRGKCVSSPGIQNTIRIHSVKDVMEKKPVLLKGEVTSRKIRTKNTVLLVTDKKIYTAKSNQAATTLEEYMGKFVQASCFLYGADRNSTWIEEICSITETRQTATVFHYPCRNYKRRIAEKGAFGLLCENTSQTPPQRMFHLGESIVLKPGAPVKSIAAGKVMYSDFIPSWDNPDGTRYSGLGGVIIIEHKMSEHEGTLEYVCSFYAYLARSRKIKQGELVVAGQIIGSAGRKNGGHPGTFFFGLHKGPYHQLSPAQKCEMQRYAETTGFPSPDGNIVKGKVREIRLKSDTLAEIFLQESSQPLQISLFVEINPPPSAGHTPAPLPGWSMTLGTAEALKEWLKPSQWLKMHKAKN